MSETEFFFATLPGEVGSKSFSPSSASDIQEAEISLYSGNAAPFCHSTAAGGATPPASLQATCGSRSTESKSADSLPVCEGAVQATVEAASKKNDLLNSHDLVCWSKKNGRTIEAKSKRPLKAGNLLSVSCSGAALLDRRRLDDVAGWVERLLRCEPLLGEEVVHLCKLLKDLLKDEPNCVQVSTPVTVAGDIHGQFYDLLELFRIGGMPPFVRYLFLGDYVDRGFYSIEVFCLIAALKVLYPAKVFLLRGNHESRGITQVYGFYDECARKYGDSFNVVWTALTEAFDFLPLSAQIEDDSFCDHGGLSKQLMTVDSIQEINRFQEPPQDGGMCDLLWSDPYDHSVLVSEQQQQLENFQSPVTADAMGNNNSRTDRSAAMTGRGTFSRTAFVASDGQATFRAAETADGDFFTAFPAVRGGEPVGGVLDEEGWGPSSRGAGVVWGAMVTEQFLHLNNVRCICRAHQLAQDGYQWCHSGKVCTVFSAPNYCYRCGNQASLMILDDKLERSFVTFSHAPERGEPQQARSLPDYFL